MQHDERPEIIDGILSVRYGDRWVPVPRGGADDGDPDETEGAPPTEGEGAPGDGGQPGEGGEQGGESGDAAPAEGQAPQVPVGEAIQAADEDELRALHSQLEEHRVACRDARDVDGVRQALADQARIVEELNRRITVETEKDEQLAALDAQETPGLPEARVPAGAKATAAQLAAAGNPQPKAEQATPPAKPKHRAPLLAAAGTEVVPAGSEMSYGQLGAAIDRAKRGRAGQTILASIPGFEEESVPGGPDLLSDRNGTSVNDEFIQEAVADWWARRSARMAGASPQYARQGAICEPFDIIRDIPDAFVTDTPVADIFPSRPAGRGGFTFTRSGTLADVLGGVSLWDEADQAAVDPDDSGTWKPCVEFDCPTPATAILEWITACVTFDITLEMSSPERVRNLNNALNALEARIYEGRILQRIDQLSHGFVFAGEYGALPTVIEAVNTVMAQLTFANRQSPGGYDLVLPPGFTETLRIDRANKGFNAQEDAEVMAILRANLPASVNVVNSLDASLGGEPGLPFISLPPVGNQTGAAAPDYLNGRVLRLRLVDPSAAIYAETGEMNAGVLRDSNLIRQNKTGYFRERGFFLEKHGPQPWATIDVDLCADGARAALVDPTRCLTS